MGKFDQDGAVERLQGLYTSQDIVRQRAKVLDVLRPRQGERCLDIGCGTGLLSAELASAVGPSGEVIAVDSSKRMVAATQELADAHGHAVEARLGDATALPVDDGWADIAVATQVFEYVPDVELALAEARRVLRVGGRLLVLDTEWRTCVWEADDRHLVDRLLTAWRDQFVHPDLPRHLPALLHQAGFDDIRADGFPIVNLTLEADDFSRGMLTTILAFLADHPDVATSDLETFEQDLRHRAVSRRYYFSVTRSVFLATAGEESPTSRQMI